MVNFLKWEESETHADDIDSLLKRTLDLEILMEMRLEMLHGDVMVTHRSPQTSTAET